MVSPEGLAGTWWGFGGGGGGGGDVGRLIGEGGLVA